ncbi:MAG: hypothetical protein KVP17_001001 [Porospora cf. gigantea B]|uniref:uncharacterized protein n=1 Tax=Porospora cf. gigantea B TaxID=2853592 RepID=UPI003571B645|nr:MAG: hypothetical protein KVP17_001001 [Porospora cf. gigantea B]
MTLLNVFSVLTTPTTYCLAAYLLFFGILVVLVELQEYAVFSRSSRTPLDADLFYVVVEEWFRFLCVPGGKALFYFLLSLLGLMAWTSSLPQFVGGVVMMTLAVINFIVHFTALGTPENHQRLLEEGPIPNQEAIETALSHALGKAVTLAVVPEKLESPRKSPRRHLSRKLTEGILSIVAGEH